MQRMMQRVAETRLLNQTLWLVALLSVLSGCQGAAPILVELKLDNPNVRSGEQVRLQASADVPLYRITFYEGDRMLGRDAREPFEWPWTATDGAHLLRAEAETEDGRVASGSLSMTVGAGDGQAPFASIAADFTTGPAPLTVTFDASDSSDPNGDALSYRWDFGDGVSAEGAQATHSFREGRSEVTLSVRDPAGNSDTAQLTITATAPVTPVTLPVEVFGADGHTEQISFELEDASVDTLYLQTHRLAYRDASTNPGRGAKGSVRLNGGAWVELHNAHEELECYQHEAEFGCLNAAYHTVRFTVPISGAKRGKNVLDFRFNGTDGFSNGYRVLAFNLRRGRGGENALSEFHFEQDDPATWTAPLGTASDITAGQNLWQSASLNKSPLDATQLQASCADCHAADGRDLKYFNYSNHTITERSKFHGLSELEGKQIASYIRSLSAPHVAQARPWNPPYQPGPGLDALPAREWSAGAGLAWVLERDADTAPYLFPEGDSAAVRATINKDSTLNLRELPIAFQFPDWNDWLPEVHPLDAWGDGFKTRKLFYGESMYDTYLRVRRELESKSGAARAADGSLKRLLNDLATQTTDFSDLRSNALRADGKSGEAANQSTSHWGAVKTWEIMQEFGLDGLAPQVYKEGEARSWMSTRRNVFEMAPHRAARNAVSFAHQSQLVGKYKSTAWYQLQLVLNAGNGDADTLWPVDWNYQPNHIKGLWDKGGPAQPYRYLASHTKMYQQFGDGKSLSSTALGMRQIHIHRYVPGQSHGRLLDRLPEDVRSQVYAALLNATVDVLEVYSPEAWRGKTHGQNSLEPLEYVITRGDIERKKLHDVCFVNNYANCWYSALPYFREAGVDAATLKRVTAWGEVTWPNNDWDKLR